MDEDQISDQMLIEAARKRLMQELAGGGGGQSPKIMNNIYGAGGGQPPGGGGMFEGGMGGGGGQGGGEDPFDYFVDIERRDVFGDPVDTKDAKGNVVGSYTPKLGWDKKVHRFRGSKGPKPQGL